jgi:UDP-glucose 4-epimerase
MNILITGGAGFIGSHLATYLVNRGDIVYVLDDYSTGSEANVEHLSEQSTFEYHYGEVQNETLLGYLMGKCEQVYHLASSVGADLVSEDPIGTIKNNIESTEAVLKSAKLYGVKVLFTSSSEIYGKSTDIPFKEEGDRVLGSTVHFRWSYSYSKSIDEILCFAYYKEFGLPVVMVRLFNTIGIRQSSHYGMVVPRFINQALNNEPITVFGDGKQSRCFSAVGDIVRGLVDIMNCEEAKGEVFNLGNDLSITIEDLAIKIKELAKSNSQIHFIPYEEVENRNFGDSFVRVPDLTKIREYIDFKADKLIDKTLTNIIGNMKNDRSENNTS